MRKPGMIQLDASQFSNVVGAIQRTGSLTGGAIRGLPNGVVIGGLPGVNSFASALSEAQKEFQLGRPQAALERVRQLETQFNGISGRWNATVASLVSSARQGTKGIPLQKLNDVKGAQSRMQQLTGPVTKSFRDLITALEFEITMQARHPEENQSEPKSDNDPKSDNESDPPSDSSQRDEPSEATDEATRETPGTEALGKFADEYKFGPQLRVKQTSEQRSIVVPKINIGTLYFFAGMEPGRVVKVLRLQKDSALVFDTLKSREASFTAKELSTLIRNGIWLLQPK